MRERTYTIRGIAPLVMHNERLADPLNKWTKLVADISKKRKKTEDDLIELSRREWFGGLYLGDDDSPCVPERNLERMLRDAAAKSKRGKDVQSGCIVTTPARLEYRGPRDAEAMWADGGFLLRATAGVGRQRIVGSRPIFHDWSLSFTVEYDENVLEAGDVDKFVELAGRYVGLCDWRPKHGRFQVEKVE